LQLKEGANLSTARKGFRCSVCGGIASYFSPALRRHFCDEHFTDTIVERVRRSINKYKLAGKLKRVVVGLSGGKDSVTLLSILQRLADEFGFEILAVHINLGIGEYSKYSEQVCRELTEKLGIPLLVLNLADLLGMTLPQIVRRSRRPACSVCGTIKRYLLNVVGVEACATAVALGHNADDIAAYILKNFFLQNLSAIKKQGPATDPIDGLAVGRVRPLYEILEDETRSYVKAAKLPYVQAACPFKPRHHFEAGIKRALELLEDEVRGLRLDFLRRIAKNLDVYPNPSEPVRACSICGMISSAEVCAFCKLTTRITGRPLGASVRQRVRETLASLGLGWCKESSKSS